MDSLKPSLVSHKWLLCSSLGFLCLFLLSLGLLMGSNPLQAFMDPQQDSKLQVAETFSPPDDHIVATLAPNTGASVGEHQEVEETGSMAPAAAPAGEGEYCDIFDGSWVYDPAGYPLYEARHCPFLSDQVTCRKNGRPDSGYEHWRWQPKGCGALRFEGRVVLEQWRDKRVVLVGDSLNRNMWESLACILYTSAMDRSRTLIDDLSSEYKIFHATEYNCSVEFYWSPFLVELEEKEDHTRALKLDKLPGMSRRWLGADIMVFNTGHWWTHTGKFRAWDHLERNGQIVKMEGEEAFSRAFRTWARWVDQNVDRTRTRVFFRSVSPEHKSANWCYNQTSPITSETYIQWFPRSLISIVERNIRKTRTPVTYLNITRLSEFRRDAHPSVFTVKGGKLLTLEQREQPSVYADCSHWCLPGVPDTWNVLLIASLMRTPSNAPLLG